MSSELQTTASEFTATTQAELCRFLADNVAGERRALLPVGGRTSLHYGNAPLKAETILATSGLTRVVDYPARDMTITVEAGIRLDDLKTLLKSEGQQLPIDIAQSQRAALGGAVATDTGGPRRLGYGTFRDYVIGLSAVTADGKLFHSGGRVVKNVAGYDMCKLLVGSMGTLAVITQLTLKLRPLPEKSAQVWAAYRSFADLDRALESLLRSATRPVALDVLNPEAADQIAAAARCDVPK
jgi:glycolate oxidase FAD binding subunit